MIYVKSFLVGLAAVFVVFVLIPLLILLGHLAVFIVRGLARGGVGFGFERPRWHAPSMTLWLLMLTVFSIAFVWEYRRVSR